MPAPAPPPTQAILVVEDESLQRMMAVDMLEDAGFHVLEAATGEAALKMLQSDDLISGLFTDVELGGDVDGFALARVAHDRHPRTAVIIVSGRRIPKPADLPSGAVFIGKPYDTGHVVRTLHKILADPDTPPQS